jgi:MFS family permease
MSHKARTFWVFAITSIGIFMVTLDNLVVTTAIPVIRQDLHASIENLEWTVNAYTLTFAVLLLTGAALGDRFGRRRMFVVGVGIFTLASAAAALAPTAGALIAARAFQGVGGAIVTPLTLTILSAGVPVARRGARRRVERIAGLAVAFGPLFGGAVVDGINWHWIFWLNVPVGLVLIPLALLRLDESYGPKAKLDLGGLGLVSAGLFGIVWGLVRGNAQGGRAPRSSARSPSARSSLRCSSCGVAHRSAMLPMRFFKDRVFSLANLASLLMFFGMFGSIFLLAQFFQTVQGYSPSARASASCRGR